MMMMMVYCQGYLLEWNVAFVYYTRLARSRGGLLVWLTWPLTDQVTLLDEYLLLFTNSLFCG